MFNIYKKNAGELEIQLNKIKIANKNNVKILGVIFYRRLTWLPYIKHLKKLTTSLLKIIKILSHATWGSKTKTLSHRPMKAEL
jgi:hypothetical protein